MFGLKETRAWRVCQEYLQARAYSGYNVRRSRYTARHTPQNTEPLAEAHVAGRQRGECHSGAVSVTTARISPPWIRLSLVSTQRRSAHATSHIGHLLCIAREIDSHRQVLFARSVRSVPLARPRSRPAKVRDLHQGDSPLVFPALLRSSSQSSTAGTVLLLQ